MVLEFPNMNTGPGFVLLPLAALALVTFPVFFLLPPGFVLPLWWLGEDLFSLSVSIDIPMISTNILINAFISASLHGRPSFFLEPLLLVLLFLPEDEFEDEVDLWGFAAAAAAALSF